MSDRFSEPVLRSLDRDKLVARIARYEWELEVQQEVVNRLDRLLDTEQRDLYDTQRALGSHRDALEQIDALPKVDQ